MLQNGADPYTISQLWITNSLRDMQSIFKKDKAHRDQIQQQEFQQKQAELQQQQQQFQAEAQQKAQTVQAEMENDNYNKQLDRLSKERVATISAAGRNEAILNDSNGNGLADALDLSAMTNQVQAAERQHQLAQAKILSDAAATQGKLVGDSEKRKNDYDLKIRELDLKEQEIKQRQKDSENKLKIAKTNKNRFSK
jgi:hypothetical protein